MRNEAQAVSEDYFKPRGGSLGKVLGLAARLNECALLLCHGCGLLGRFSLHGDLSLLSRNFAQFAPNEEVTENTSPDRQHGRNQLWYLVLSQG